MSQYFYDKQFRRYILQVIRIFSEFEVDMGKGVTKVVPCMMGDLSTIAAAALNRNSENTVLPLPLISVYITALQLNDEMRHAPWVDGRSQFTEKAVNDEGNRINKPAYKWEIRQHMAVPFKLEFNVDIATSSLNQKMELLEQILVLFNPGFNIKVNKSPFDAHNQSFIKITNVQWSSKTPPDIPIDGAVEYSTLTFEIDPVWLGTPAKIKKQSLIQHIILNVDVGEKDQDNDFNSFFTDRLVIKPTDYEFEVYRELGQYYGRIIDTNGVYMSWKDFFQIYPDINEEISNIRIRQDDDITNNMYDIYSMFKTTSDDTVLELNIDERTIPETTLPNVSKIINPAKIFPSCVPEGTRYLIVDRPSDAWSLPNADAGDIIEFNGAYWIITFDASEAPEDTLHFIMNNAKNDVYKFVDGGWVNGVAGTYSYDFWFFDVQVLRGKS